MQMLISFFTLIIVCLVCAQDKSESTESHAPIKPPEVSGIEINNTGDKGELELIGSFFYDRYTPGAEIEVEYAPARWLSLEAELPVYFKKPYFPQLELDATFSILRKKEKGMFLSSGLEFSVPFTQEGEFELEPWLGLKKTFAFLALLSKVSVEFGIENKEELEYGVKAAFGPYFPIKNKMLIGSPLNYKNKEDQHTLLSGLECDFYFTDEITVRFLGQYHVVSEEKGPYFSATFKAEFE